MQSLTWGSFKSALREKGVLLAAVNLALACICAMTLLGFLAATFVLAGWLQSSTGNPRVLVPFPAPVLFLLYVIAFVLTWTRFARGLQPGPTSYAIRTGLVGASPLLGLSLLGYLSVVWVLATGDFGPDSMLEATVFVYGILSTLILFAGVACMAFITLLSPRPHA